MFSLIKGGLARLIYNERLAVVPAHLRPTWPQRMFLKRLLRELQIDCVLDVGANGGQYGAELRRIGYCGHILSFEPDPTAYGRLARRSAEDIRWHTFNLALGEKSGRASLNIMNVSLFNSFKSPSTTETDKFSGANEVSENVAVDMVTLSEALPNLRAKYGFKRVFLKMDTQGYDLEVFRGAMEVHSAILAFQSEIAIKRLYEGVPPWTQQIAAYTSSGFELSGIFPVNPSERELVEMDCYFRNLKP